jgi:spore maturation protein CgeB
MGFFEQCFTFDPPDTDYIARTYGIPCEQIPLGFDPRIYCPNETVQRDIDISFVGAPTKNRLELLQQVAEYAQAKKKKFVVYGGYWNKRHFWSKMLFRKKYSPLHQFIPNIKIPASLTAQIYRRSKVCLNIHISNHEGINPRTFEILGTQSFQLVDQKERLSYFVDPGQHVVSYESSKDLIEKLDFYLENENEREKIAKQGFLHAQNYSIYKVTKYVLSKFTK